MPFILDCSMTMAWVFPDEANELTDALRDSLIADNAIVPALWPVEVGNVLLAATRRGRIVESDSTRIRQDLAALPIEIDRASPETVLKDVIPIAREYEISVYDAMHLELGLRLRLPLATLDRKLVAACNAAGTEVLPAG